MWLVTQCSITCKTQTRVAQDATRTTQASADAVAAVILMVSIHYVYTTHPRVQEMIQPKPNKNENFKKPANYMVHVQKGFVIGIWENIIFRDLYHIIA